MKKGFTYVEVLVILAIISILSTFVSTYFKARADQADDVYTHEAVITFINTFNLFYKDNKAFPLPNGTSAAHSCLTEEPCQFNNQTLKRNGAVFAQLRPYLPTDELKTTHERLGVQGILYTCQEVTSDNKCSKALMTWAEKISQKNNTVGQCLRGSVILSDKNTRVCQYDFR
jgi:type II secretory pathway pseudopilin PulG